MSTFVKQSGIAVDHLDWGDIGWRARPANTGCKTFVVMDVSLEPGFGHDFHKHPEQDEMIIVKAGSIEQWIEQDHTILEAGDSVFLDANVVHASFNIGTETAHLQVVLAPAVGDEGYQLVDVSAEEPWASLR
ncbi:MAG TPA: cupin domain-containing protein [Gaiellales bacterium]|jgi:quercetin dioxygenase-like cupin family protein|nr:cupin domain-containing protein [Gaiellales bacterium]